MIELLERLYREQSLLDLYKYLILRALQNKESSFTGHDFEIKRFQKILKALKINILGAFSFSGKIRKTQKKSI